MFAVSIITWCDLKPVESKGMPLKVYVVVACDEVRTLREFLGLKREWLVCMLQTLKYRKAFEEGIMNISHIA